jgi:hypothetical protein
MGKSRAAPGRVVLCDSFGSFISSDECSTSVSRTLHGQTDHTVAAAVADMLRGRKVALSLQQDPSADT